MSRAERLTGMEDPGLHDPAGWEEARCAAESSAAGWAGAALPLLNAGQEPVLGFWIEAGVFAWERLEHGGDTLDRQSRADLRQVVIKGEAARERLIRSNVRLVYYWASRRTFGRNVGTLDIEDLVGEGMAGLTHAVQLWDYTLGLKFSTYASGWIRMRIGRAAVRAALVSIGGPDRDRLAALSILRREHLTRQQDPPTVAEVADHLSITHSAARDLMSMWWNTQCLTYLDRPVDPHDAGARSLELIDPGPRPDEIAVAADRGGRVAAALAGLPERDRAIVCARVGWSDGRPASERELAARYGVTQSQVRAIAVRAVSVLRGDLADLDTGSGRERGVA